jgi:hypothetical protein
MHRWPSLVVLLLLVVTAGAWAQGPRPESSLGAVPPGAAPGPDAYRGAHLPAAGAADTLPCPDCNPPTHFWVAAGELMLMQLIPHTINYNIRGAVWAHVTPQSIKNNLAYPWQWDDNQFLNNQFSHPYHGAMYFSSARTNGYDFWESFAWPFVGSAMWELAGEAWAPAPNDFLNTSFGGVVLGESLFRLSNLTLDNTATGSERTWREIGGFLLNPLNGFNRLVRGQTHGVSANPPDWRPSQVIAVLDVGYRSVNNSFSLGDIQNGTDQWDIAFGMAYGDPIKDLGRKPFSYFALATELAGPATDSTRRFNRLSVRGSLAAWPLGSSGRHQLAIGLGYDYYNNPAVEYGGQSVQAGVVSVFGKQGGNLRVQTSALFNGIIIGATQSDYYATLEGRNYDYGPGVGATLTGRLLYKRRVDASLGYNGIWIFTVDGSESTHHQDVLNLSARYWLTDRLGVGVAAAGYARQSDYANAPNVTQKSTFLRAFVSTAIPGVPQ